MARKKKDGKFLNIYMDRELNERIRIYAEEKGQSITVAIERILKEYLDNIDKTKKA